MFDLINVFVTSLVVITILFFVVGSLVSTGYSEPQDGDEALCGSGPGIWCSNMSILHKCAPPKFKCTSAITPAVRTAFNTEGWKNAHLLMALDAEQQGSKVNLLFLGDSITERWRGVRSGNVLTALQALPPLFQEKFGKYAPLALGTSGDQTQNLLWRLIDGELPPSGVIPVSFLLSDKCPPQKKNNLAFYARPQMQIATLDWLRISDS